ncbi:hypothetical protein [Nonomuraea soli]|uniref:Uncharacterized protein n=1 Tax=Nonomuraea soli TaxID=1032476 RepID=A0A7W0CFG5_9ACTN|nr:hypothetical protein [Nonomuraea soli]MBA2890211.1 hypothetical protein [Nonomuraea soli]
MPDDTPAGTGHVPGPPHPELPPDEPESAQEVSEDPAAEPAAEPARPPDGFEPL